jgi:S-adenosylmethionine-diacylgycerolhomoserine-N-methlytransferase
MAPSTSPASPPPPEAFGLDALSRFYRFHARVYDWTRPLLLFGRRAAVRTLAPRAGDTVLDVGCGTGFSLPLLAASGAKVVGIEPSPAMRQRAEALIARQTLGDRVALDPRPYGTHRGCEGSVDRILFSYSLSMVPPYAQVLEQADRDLRRGGRIVVVDFLDARPPVSWGLRASHVFLGGERLQALRRLFPDHVVEVREAVFWRFFLFEGRAG